MRSIRTDIDPKMFQSQEGKALAKVVKQLAIQSNEQKDEIRAIKTRLRSNAHFKRK